MLKLEARPQPSKLLSLTSPLIALAITLYLFRQASSHGRPFLIAAGFIAAQAISFDTLGRIPGWAPMFAAVSRVNLPLLLFVFALLTISLRYQHHMGTIEADVVQQESSRLRKRLIRSGGEGHVVDWDQQKKIW